MFTENGIVVDLSEVKKAVRQADVFAIGFHLFPQRLLIDTRFDDNNPPLIQVVEPVASVEQRFFWLGQHRPSLGTPERFLFFVWPHSISYLQESSLARAIRERMGESGYAKAASDCKAAFKDLAARERKAVSSTIKGENCFTLWPRA